MNTPLTAAWAGHVSSVVINDDHRDHPGSPAHFAIHLDAEAAASLALALLRAAHQGGADVFEHVRDAAEELTDVEFLAYTLLDDLRADYGDESEQDEKANDEPILSWDEVLALGGGSDG